MKHQATVVWTFEGEDMPSGRYSRAYEMRFDGGAVVPGSPAPEIVRAPWSKAENVDPEEMFVASVAACHMLWFLDVARHAGLSVESYTDRAEGVMTKNGDGELWISRVTLNPRIDWRGKAPRNTALARLHDDAHHKCFIANSIRTEVVVAAYGDGG
jgi:organic hydroperoxide reductase OsmC/OhrA